jgi:hypothetical protein
MTGVQCPADRTILETWRAISATDPASRASSTDLAQARADRERRRRTLVTFHHLSDFRILDEESPLRAEWADSCEPALDGISFRPQEVLSVQAADALIAAANALSISPVTGQPAQFAFHTGNATDNAQYNELRWFLDLMDGNPVYPDSGAIGYQGVQRESPAGAYPDLLEQGQRNFAPIGLSYPWYAVAGNRDLLAQGSVPPSSRTSATLPAPRRSWRSGPRPSPRRALLRSS